jgi:hypothetical protein
LCLRLIVPSLTPSTSSEAAAPLLARRTSWGSQRSRSRRLMRLSMPLLVAPHGVDNVLARRASLIGGPPIPLSATRPLSVDGGLTLRVAADHSSTVRLSAATPIPAHRATSREELESVRRMVYDADGIIIHLCRVNGDIDRSANAPSGAVPSFSSAALTSRRRACPRRP